MKAATFLKQFEHLAEAPNGIAKLRELVLQLAVHGKLVPQDPNDEPASELLKKIQTEKRRRIAEGKIRNSKPLPPIDPEEMPHELPESWRWERLGRVTYALTDGSHNPPPKQDDGIPMLSSQNVLDGSITLEASRYISKKDLEGVNKRYEVCAGDVLLTIVASIGRSAVVPSAFPIVALQRSIALVRSGLYAPFLSFCLRAPDALRYYGVHGKGTAQKGIYLGKLSMMPVCVPPLAEQKRIVAKVNKLMALCDDLETKQQAKRTKQIALNRASLHALTEPIGTSLATAWHCVRDHFDNLYTVPETVAELRQTILQLAVMGCLVRQDPNDEPASELLKRIQAEKQRLIAEDKIRKSKPLPPLGVNQILDEIPESWEWTRIREITHDLGQKVPDTPFTYIDVTAIDKERGCISSEAKVLKANQAPSRARKLVAIGSVIYSTVRPYLLNIAIVDRQFDPDPIVSTAFAVLHPFLGICSHYLYYYLRSPSFIEYVNGAMTGMAYPAINDAKMSVGLVPLPPLAEQKRIVAKVDQLMALCDDLAAKLQQAQTDADNLLTAIVHELTESTEGTAAR